MTDFERRRDAVLIAETRADLARRLFDLRRRELASKTRLWGGPVAILSGLFLGWRFGRPSASASTERPHNAARHHSAASPNTSRKRAVTPSTLGFLSLLVSGLRVAPFVLPLALSWMDKRHAARSAQAGAPIAVPTWMVVLRRVCMQFGR